ncbi:hypothetical protein SCORR_v1c03670 [Spiroplasma corruscae]|uniref:Uncharacterized protein n=1 Tax=Spiroplasma corruscae TaxID=216934 RepID=A0A222EP19_9MOLU|nr:hypothetical protein [Spiroplasma corruscae]ASP28141.1 hypothetical protein SCORR_v1c03670 [Spiroplasma corruscae]
MIQYLRAYKVNETSINNLRNVRPFWQQSIKKQVKKLKKWLFKFQRSDLKFKIDYPGSYTQYIKFLREVSNFNNFLNQKSDSLKANLKIYSKFYKIFVDYSYLLGWANFIEITIKYYDDIQTDTISELSIHYLKLVNDTIFKLFVIYKKEVLKALEDDEYIKLLTNDVVVPDKQILIVNDTLNKIIKYAKTLFRKKKISEETYLKISSLTLELVNFNYSFSYYSYKLLKNFN